MLGLMTPFLFIICRLCSIWTISVVSNAIIILCTFYLLLSGCLNQEEFDRQYIYHAWRHKKYICKILFQNLSWKKPMHKLEDNVNEDCRVVGGEGMTWLRIWCNVGFVWNLSSILRGSDNGIAFYHVHVNVCVYIYIYYAHKIQVMYKKFLYCILYPFFSCLWSQ